MKLKEAKKKRNNILSHFLKREKENKKRMKNTRRLDTTHVVYRCLKTTINAINAEQPRARREERTEKRKEKKKSKKRKNLKKNLRKFAGQRTENYSRGNIAGTMAFDARTIPKISKAGARPGQRPCARSRLTMKLEILRAPFSFDNVAVMRRGNT